MNDRTVSANMLCSSLF